MTGDRDLGPLRGSLLVFGGPYGNLQAVRAVRAEAERLRIPPERVICTGDVVAYGGDPVATVDLIRDWGIPVVRGNCDESLGAGAEDCGCGFDPGSDCAAMARDWYAHCAASLSDDRKAWLGGLPQRLRFRLGSIRGVAIHGGAQVTNRFLFASRPASVLEAEADALDADLVLAGHCGIPFSRELSRGRLWHNAGVIGLPANDGTADVWYSVVEPTPQGIQASHRRLAYDAAAAAASLRAAGLPEGYADCLESGLWPSLDVLPDAEKAAGGRALSPAVGLVHKTDAA